MTGVRPGQIGILAGDGVRTEALATLAGEAADYVICSKAGRSLERMGPRYARRFGVPIQIYAPFTYDGAWPISFNLLI
jgi:branched-chain amino acid transport system substrate-binding protein